MNHVEAGGGQPVRVGAVSYLNAKPLVYYLREFAPQVELHCDVPSRLADLLAAGRLDVGLIPSIEYASNPSYRIVSDACIACRGPVLSVKLLSRVPIGRIRSLALDAGSRTSSVLARVLLNERFGLRPALEALPIGCDAAGCASDAVLLIGDRAIHTPGDGFVESWDLGDQWYRWSGLPFVFAMWVARPGVDVSELAAALAQARDKGMERLEAIARAEAAAAGLSVAEAIVYLRDNLHFYLGPHERDGLTRFYRLAARLGAAPPEVALRFG